MMKLKKSFYQAFQVIPAISLLFLVLALTACGTEEPQAEPTPQPAPQTEQPVDPAVQDGQFINQALWNTVKGVYEGKLVKFDSDFNPVGTPQVFKVNIHGGASNNAYIHGMVDFNTTGEIGSINETSLELYHHCLGLYSDGSCVIETDATEFSSGTYFKITAETETFDVGSSFLDQDFQNDLPIMGVLIEFVFVLQGENSVVFNAGVSNVQFTHSAFDYAIPASSIQDEIGIVSLEKK